MKTIELTPTNGRKSFYGKACILGMGNQRILFSYESAIMTECGGQYIRHYAEDGKCTNTTLTHIKSFCGMNKKEFLLLPFGPIKK